MTRIDSSGKPTWSIPPTDYLFWSWNIAIHPDGTIFILADIKNPAYVVGIDGLTGREKFRVPLMTTDIEPSPITIAPDGNAYLEHVVGTATGTQQNGNPTIIDGTSTISLRIMKIASDGTCVDSEIQSWSSTYHEEDDFSDDGTTEVATYSYSPAPLPLVFLKEIIPDNHGNLLASWSYGVPGWTRTCTTINRQSQQQSTTCTGEVPGQDSQAHVGLLNGLALQNDFTLSGVDEFTGPMVMGEGDTAFAMGAKNGDSLNRIAAFNATTGADLWSTAGTADLLEPVAATADGGVVITDTPGSGGAIVIDYDSNGNPNSSQDSVPAVDYSYSYLGKWNALGMNNEVLAFSRPSLDVATTSWGTDGGGPSKTRAATPTVNEVVRHGIANLAQGYIGSTNWVSDTVTCNLFVAAVISEALQGTGLQSPQTERLRILPAIPPLSCSVTVFTTQIPALAADWATPSKSLSCWSVVPEGPDGALPGDVLATGNRDDGQYPNGPDGTGHVGVVTYPNIQLTGNSNAKLASAATIAPPYWPSGTEFQSGTITLTDYGFRVFDPSQPAQNEGLKTDSTVRRFTCY